MADGLTEIMSQEVPCRDPECMGTAEPDQDGDHLMYECNVCGYIFGYERVPQPALSGEGGGSCSVGIPESVRRAASKFGGAAAMDALGDERIPLRDEPSVVPVTLGRKPT